MGNISQFYKTILLIVISIGVFLGLKSFLPDRLFPENLVSDASMLIDSVLLDALGGNALSLDELDLTDTIPMIEQIEDGRLDSIGAIGPNPVKDSMNAVMAEQALTVHTVLTLKPFQRSNFARKLEKRKPVLFMPNENTHFVTERPIIDTLLDPTVSLQGYGYLQRFYAKLKNIEDNGAGRARIAYFGDSMNDGDFIVQDVRSLFQDEYGGSGVGFVAITSKSAGSRGSVYHKHSENWNTQSFISVKRPSTPFGVDGQVFTARDAGTYWASYTAGNAKNSPALYSPTLFYGYSKNEKGAVDIKINNGASKKSQLIPSYTLNTLHLGENQAKSVRANFSNIGNVPIYGFDFSSHTGVHVDNFSLRGNSGLTLAGFNTSLMNAFDNVMHYDLIVLHFGTNVLNYGSNDYTFYERGMTAVINKLRHCFPNADILVISTADKASKINMQMVTDPAVVPLVKAQKRFARDTGTGFVDLYNLMGGNGSMVDWVNKQLANRDYTHFNVKGSKEIGTLLYQEIQRGYSKYKSQLEKEKRRKDIVKVE